MCKDLPKLDNKIVVDAKSWGSTDVKEIFKSQMERDHILVSMQLKNSEDLFSPNFHRRSYATARPFLLNAN